MQKISLTDLFVPRARQDSDHLCTVMGVPLFHPDWKTILGYAGLSLLIKGLLFWSTVDPQQASMGCIGIFSAGIAQSMGVDVRRHGVHGLLIVLWITALAVLFVRLFAGLG